MSVSGQRLSQRQGQSLAMTALQRRSLRLLEMPAAELNEMVEQELAQNPVLERMEAGFDEFSNAKPLIARTAPSHEKSSFRRDIDRLRLWPGATSAATRPGKSVTVDGGRTPASKPAAPAVASPSAPSLSAYIIEQINIELPDSADRSIGLLLLEQLDDAGYLVGGADAVGRQAGCSADRVERVIIRLQQLDPPGIFARSLSECLALQLRDRRRLTPAMAVLLANLPLVAKGDRRRLMVACGVGADELSRMIAELRTLNPKPATAIAADVAGAAMPDVTVRPGGNGEWIVESFSDRRPRLLVNEDYARRLRGNANSATREFLSDRLAEARWLLRTLRRRDDTVLDIAKAMVRHQDAFLREGIARLRPLTRRDLARSIGIHESTVSRATSGKYMETPRGLIPFNAFFSGRVKARPASRDCAAAAVKARIGTLIRDERDGPELSDQRIARMLRADGIFIARRTIAKYRKFLRLPSSTGRRRRRRLQGA